MCLASLLLLGLVPQQHILLPELDELGRYERALLRRLGPARGKALEVRANTRHLLPRVSVSGNASSWDRLAFDDSSTDYRRAGMSIVVSLQWDLPALAYDAEERALLGEAREARKEQDALIKRLHSAWFDARVLLDGAARLRPEAVDVNGINAAVLAVAAIAYGAAYLAAEESP